MSEEFIGDSDLGTADVNIEVPVETQTPEVSIPEQTQEAPAQTQDISGMERELKAVRERADRLEKYNEFLRNIPDPNTVKDDPFASIKSLEKDQVPFVEDVEKIVEYALHQRSIKENEERVVNEVKVLADERKAKDPSYLEKLNLAFELAKYDKSLVDMVEAQPTAQGKLEKLEWIAMAHPLYGNIGQKTSQQEVIDRVQKNAGLPPTLSSVPSLSTTSVPISQMTPEQFQVYFKSVKAKL